MKRVSLKIVGASGQGINAIGEILAKGLKRAGYCVFGYREYPSLIKGGHASYQLDVSGEPVFSTEETVDLLIALNHHGLERNLRDLKEGGIIVHSVQGWKFPAENQELIQKRKLSVIDLPVERILRELKAKTILGNVVFAAFTWAILGCDKEQIRMLVGERFAKKKSLLEANMQCIDRGFEFADSGQGKPYITLPRADSQWKDHMLITGSQAIGLGAVHAGVRFYAGYPMTPASPLLSFIADLQNRTGMVVKQAEDEITAAQLVSGAMYMGTRALTATSGGGFDLMSETLSMNGIIENPAVLVLAQRPGPGTGLPTWTAQGDLLMAVGTSHGEFPRCVLGVSDANDAFALMPIAFDLAEKYQISVIVLTDKQIAEALYTEPPFDQSNTKIDRGNLITDAAGLAELKSSDRYYPSAKDGISPRWLPGSRAETHCAQADEHSADGSVDESASNARAQMEKRMRKLEALKRDLPEPELMRMENPSARSGGAEEWTLRPGSGQQEMENGNRSVDVLLVGWGSTKSTVVDVLKEVNDERIGYLHYMYLWPLKTDRLVKLAKKAKKVVLVEQNYQGQLGQLIQMECGLAITDRILKYDGRPFFYNELLTRVNELTS